MIPHAGRFHAPPPAALALPIAVIEPAFGAVTMAAPGTPPALGASLVRAAPAAVDVAAIAAPANGEHRLAARASGQSQRSLRCLHGQRCIPTRPRPMTFPNPRKPATIRGGRACAFEIRGSSTRGSGASTPGPHSLLATVGQKLAHRHTPLRTPIAGRTGHGKVGASRRGSTSGRAGRAFALGQGPFDPEDLNRNPERRAASPPGQMIRFLRF